MKDRSRRRECALTSNETMKRADALSFLFDLTASRVIHDSKGKRLPNLETARVSSAHGHRDRRAKPQRRMEPRREQPHNMHLRLATVLRQILDGGMVPVLKRHSQLMHLPLARDMACDTTRILNVLLAIEHVPNGLWFRPDRIPLCTAKIRELRRGLSSKIASVGVLERPASWSETLARIAERLSLVTAPS